jgi:CRISPR-associated protein Csm1
LNGRLREARDRAGEAVLTTDNDWREDAFVLPAIRFADGEHLCGCCGKRAGRPDEASRPETAVCPHCAAEEQIGRILPRSRYIAFFGDRQRGRPAPLGSFELLAASGGVAENAQLVVDLDGVGEGPEELPSVGGFRSRFIPHDAQTGAVVMFDELASRSLGRKALGYLKMDVDNLGHLFCMGFRGVAAGGGPVNLEANEGRDLTSISRVAALSRTLETFFSGYLERLLRGEFRNVYLIYSGGDDVAAVGPWHEMFDLALRLREDFRKFTGGNPCWTLSAGLAVVQYHTPVLMGVEEADRLLEASKSLSGHGPLPWPAPEDQAGSPEKDRLTALGTSVPWSEFPATLARGKQLYAWLHDETLRTSQVRRLLTYAEMACQFQRTHDTRYLQYVPYLVRELRRNWPEDTPARQQAREWAAQLTLPDAAEMKRLRFLCHYALYANRTPVREEER